MANTSADKLAYLQGTKDAIKAAIVNKGVAIPDETTFRGYAEKIGEIPTGGVVSKDIDFYDYDGTLVASWTLEELAAATALPDNPTHEGLTAKGWNWSLAGLKARGKPTDVRQMYVTSDGKTRIRVMIREYLFDGGTFGEVNLVFSQSVSGGTTVDWGDGSPTETAVNNEGENEAYLQHIYAQAGDYTITLTVAEGCEIANIAVNDPGSAPMVRWVEVGEHCSWVPSGYSFALQNLEYFTVPPGATGYYVAFNNAKRLRTLILPSGGHYTGGNEDGLMSCCSLEAICFPADIGLPLGGNELSGCKNLRRITCDFYDAGFSDEFPALTYLDLSSADAVSFPTTDYAFPKLASLTVPANCSYLYNLDCCVGLRDLYLLSTIPPEVYLGSGNYLPALTIHVPAGSLAAYQAANVWSNYADCMVEMEAEE